MPTKFPWDETAFRDLTREAVIAYWDTRSGQTKAQKKRKVKDTGTRGEVTGGQHLNGLRDLVTKVILAAGISRDEIHYDNALVLPGYYRAQKKWDVVVVREGRLLAAIELKSQSGSFGNNMNNRTEEVLGLAKDFWTAYRERAFGLHRPWLGYAFLLEDSEKSRAKVGLKKSPFPPFPIFENTSYAERYRILCERLVLERDYDSAALICAGRVGVGEFSELSAELSLFVFCKALFDRIKAAE